MSDSIIPTDPTELKALKSLIVEMTNCLQRMDDEREQMKDIAEAGEEKFSIQKKHLNKLARVMYKHNYQDLQAENEHFEYLYEAVMENRKSS